MKRWKDSAFSSLFWQTSSVRIGHQQVFSNHLRGRMTELCFPIFILFLLISILPFACHHAEAHEQDFVRMYMVNPLTGNETFNLPDYPINGVFTIDFYTGNITDLITWQIHLTYNRTLINYSKAWFPDNNVFKEAIDEGAIPMEGIAVNVDNATDVGDLLIVMTCTYPPSSSFKYPVTVESKELLCSVNFTIAMHSTFTQMIFAAEQQNPSSLYVAPPYFLTGYGTSAETLNGTCLADGEPAAIYDPAPVTEASLLLILLWIPSALAIILTTKRMKRCDRER
jgi:hypothetical protein